MPFIRQTKPPKEVFALATPQHMLTKLAWEIDKFERALAAEGREDGDFQSACYFAFNCAVTALHCADWAWSSAGEETRAQLARDFKFEITATEIFLRAGLLRMARSTCSFNGRTMRYKLRSNIPREGKI